MSATETKVDKLPWCDVCMTVAIFRKAQYDGATIHGTWAYMCEECFRHIGTGLGAGKGQRLKLGSEKA